MILVCPELERRLDVLWNHLQQKHFEKGISQIDLDEKCVSALEDIETERSKAVNAYENFMAINANASKISAFINARRLCPGVSFDGCSKSQMARDLAIGTAPFVPETLKELLSHFGSK